MYFFRSALILRKLRKTNLTCDDPERSRKQVWDWYFKLTFGLQGETIQRIITPNFDRVSAVLSQKLYDLSLLLFINSKQHAGKCSVFKREKSHKYLLNSNVFFTMRYNSDFPFNYVIRGILRLFLIMLESAWVFFTAPHAKVLKWL